MSWQSSTSFERYVPIKATDTFWSKLFFCCLFVCLFFTVSLTMRTRNVLCWCILSECPVSERPRACVTFIAHIRCFFKIILCSLYPYRRWDAVILGAAKLITGSYTWTWLQTYRFSLNWIQILVNMLSFYFEKVIVREFYKNCFLWFLIGCSSESWYPGVPDSCSGDPTWTEWIIS